MTNYIESPYQIDAPPAPPAPMGYWVIGKSNWGQTQFAIYKKPNKLHRFMTKLLLGWEWLDND
jgi:hypothetical protein